MEAVRLVESPASFRTKMITRSLLLERKADNGTS